jgi:hypothetical protein
MSDSSNLYIYSRNAPTEFNDPTGLQSEPLPEEELAQSSLAGADAVSTSRESAIESLPEGEVLVSVDPSSSALMNESEVQTSAVAPANSSEAPPPGEEGSNLTGASAVTTYESQVRANYLTEIRKASDEAVSEIDKLIAAVEKGTITEAEALEYADNLAREASAQRDLLRAEAQKKLLPGGKLLSEALETPLSFEERLASKGGASLSGYRDVAKSAGKSRALVSGLAKFGKVAGPVGLVVGGGLAISAVANAPPEEQTAQAVEEVAAFGGSAAGATGGTALGVAGAGGIAALLGLSGPPGWLVLGLGLVGGVGGGYLLGEGTRQGVRAAQGR